MQSFFMEEFPFFFWLDLSPTVHGYYPIRNCCVQAIRPKARPACPQRHVAVILTPGNCKFRLTGRTT
jgi:hypothetical protein